MSNDIILSDFQKDRFISAINLAVPNQMPSHMVKIKNHEHQVVIETNDYFYKVYEDKMDAGLYKLEIRQRLAKIYQSYGIHWILKSFEKDNMIYTVEEREKLPLCGKEISCKELLLGWKKTLDILEKELRLKNIVYEIKDMYPNWKNFKEIKLIRDCVNKLDDYAYGHNGEIILLDDSDWFLTLIDNDSNRIFIKNFKMDVTTTIGTMTLAMNVDEMKDIFMYSNSNVSNYFLFDCSKTNKESFNKLVNYKEEMIDNNIKLLSGIDLSEDMFKYQREYLNITDEILNNQQKLLEKA